MADEAIFVIATLTPQEGQLEGVVEGMKELAGEVEKNEPGCLLYQVFSNPADGTVLVVEKYKDKAAAEAHKSSAHFAEAMKQGGGRLTGPPKIQVLNHTAGFTRH